MSQKKVFYTILILGALILISIPFFLLFQDSLTRLFLATGLYRVVAEKITPLIVRMVAVILLPTGIRPTVAGDYLQVGVAEPILIEVAWNCLGWQSIILFVFTSWIGLQGDRYTNISKIKAWTIGFLGTFLINLTRIVIVVLFTFYMGQKAAIIFHDYFSVVFFLAWLFVYWWFSFRFVLSEREDMSRFTSAE